MYDIGFFGIKEEDQDEQFRSLGSRAPTLPPIKRTTQVVVHPSYVDALSLQEAVVGELDEESILQTAGIIEALPNQLKLTDYRNQLAALEEELRVLPVGPVYESSFVAIVERIIRLCFYRSLRETKTITDRYDGRDVTSLLTNNQAVGGFWQVMRSRYQSEYVVWECHNLKKLDVKAFDEASYYMGKQMAHVVVVCFRGNETKRLYFEQTRRIYEERTGGILLLCMEKDLRVFIRQAINGKVTDDRLQTIYDATRARSSER